jgi:hypothetical protein
MRSPTSWKACPKNSGPPIKDESIVGRIENLQTPRYLDTTTQNMNRYSVVIYPKTLLVCLYLVDVLNYCNDMYIICCTTEDAMIQAAMTPLAPVQSDCVLWLDNYFKTFGDHQPNSNCSLIATSQRLDVYKSYKSEMEGSSPHRDVVDYSKFSSLWHSLYPHCILRRKCNILGKCDTCAWIDSLRKGSAEQAVHSLCSEAHALHRGGLFQLERLA